MKGLYLYEKEWQTKETYSSVYSIVDVEAVLDETLDACERARLCGNDECVDLGIVQIQGLLVYVSAIANKLLE